MREPLEGPERADLERPVAVEPVPTTPVAQVVRELVPLVASGTALVVAIGTLWRCAL